MTRVTRKQGEIMRALGVWKCIVCGQVKPVEDFPKDRHCKKGHRSDCKKCYNARKMASRGGPNPRKLKTARQLKKRRDQYNRDYYRQKQDDLKERARQYRQKNRDIVLERDRVRKARNRAKSFGITEHFTLEQWLNLRKLCGEKCVSCKEAKPLTVDHIVPLSEGGSNTIDNIQPLCKSCNSSKLKKVKDYRPRFKDNGHRLNGKVGVN
jgi:5-methylcytosine-specific restriction endonuclease McrA